MSEQAVDPGVERGLMWPLLEKRSPRARSDYLGARRREREAAGLPTDAVDAAVEVFAELDREQVRELAGWAQAVVDSFCADHQARVEALPRAVLQSLVVQATVGFLYGYGVMTRVPLPRDEPPVDWRVCIPAHLVPDVDALSGSPDRVASAKCVAGN